VNNLQRGFPFEATVAMIPVVEEFKVSRLGSEMTIAPKPLRSEESSVVSLIEAFHYSITPRFSYRDEDYFDPHEQTEPEDDAKGVKVTIASPETEFVVELEKVRNPHSLPATDQARSHSLIVFPSLRTEKDPVAEEIDDVERIETTIVLDISWAHKIRLMDMVESQRLCEIRVVDPFGEIRSFF
jgi:hypothetical protein